MPAVDRRLQHAVAAIAKRAFDPPALLKLLEQPASADFDARAGQRLGGIADRQVTLGVEEFSCHLRLRLKFGDAFVFGGEHGLGFEDRAGQ
ncbi:Uncharacterised protein [Mycobacterium tuberculosis]|nr:Uncharacterised protein [Mycobacterium tuberculosis]